MFRSLLLLSVLWLSTFTANGILFYDLDNVANQTDPGLGFPFDAVAKVVNSSGGEITGSAVHLGSGYMLTAHHVTNRSHVSFDGSTLWEVDGDFGYTQVAAGVDLKVFRLKLIPDVSGVTLYSGNSELAAPATMVGWGVGRHPTAPLSSETVAWGSASTTAKRWGTNTLTGISTLSGDGYSYSGLYTTLNAIPNEAAATLYDSGSGLFQKLDGTWYLIGIATGVDKLNSSTFGGESPDQNYFARISAYHESIMALISIPEPNTALLLLLFGMSALSRRRRQGILI